MTAERVTVSLPPALLGQARAAVASGAAESLSAYMAYRPRPGHTDAQRNLLSNIHARGVSIADAARRIAALADRMRQTQTSGVAVKEELPGTGHLAIQ